jgi:hypothetical protein
MIKTREDLIQWALRSLGHPMIHINVTAEQLEDRLDDTLELFQEYNLGGTNRDYIRYQVSEEDIYNQYIPIDGSSVLGIMRLIPLSRGIFGNVDLVFDPIYHLLNAATDRSWASIDLTSYTMFRQYGEVLDLILKPKHNVRFNRYQNKLFIDWNWGARDWRPANIITENDQNLLTEEDKIDDSVDYQLQFVDEFAGADSKADIEPGDFIILECFKVLDPEEYPGVYGDRWLKEYFKAKVKYQWGQNLSKYSGMTLPGNVQLDGNAMINDAQAELDKLKEQLYTDYSEPLTFFIG